MKDRVIVISSRAQKLIIATGLVILAVVGAVALLARPVEVFRDIVAPFEIDYTPNIFGGPAGL